MADVYIRAANGDIFYFDAVFDVSVTQAGTPTRYAMESGAKSSDHYDQEQDNISINGSVSEVKFIRNSSEKTSLEEFEKGITALKRSGQFFTVICSKYLSPFRNCLFTSLSMSRSKETGKYAIDVSMSISQITVARAAEVSSAPIPAEFFVDSAEGKKIGSESTVDVGSNKANLQKLNNELGSAVGIPKLFEE